jgi:hypothetical protein
MSVSRPVSGLDGLSHDDLRAAVRAVLHEVMPSVATGAVPPAELEEPEPVTLHTDAELAAFVRRVATMCEDSSIRSDLREGRRGFLLSRSQPAGRGASVIGTDRHIPGVHRVEHGAVTERRVQQAAADGARLVIGRKAVLTPLARDRARTLGVVVEKER